MKISRKNLIIISFSLLFLSSCTSLPPLPSENFKSIRANLNQYEGQIIRLGGKVTSVSISNEEVMLEVLSIPLKLGQPLLNAQPDGRFVAIIPKSKFPEQITPIDINGAFLTIIGQVEGQTYVDNRVGYFSTFSLYAQYLTFFEFNQLALSQQLIEEKNDSLEEIKAMIDVKINELQYLTSLLPKESDKN